MKNVMVILITLFISVLPGLSPGKMTSPVIAELETRIQTRPTLEAMIQLALKKNPDIQRAREKWRATVARYHIETAYPDPQLMATFFPDPIETRLGPQDWHINLSQAIPFPGKLSKAGDVVMADAKIAQLSLDKTIRDVVVSIRETVYELIYLRKARHVAAQQIRLLAHLRKIAETAYARDRGNFVDVVKAQSQSGQLRYDALLLKDLEETEVTRLNSLLNRAPGASLGLLGDDLPEPVSVKLEQLYRFGEKNQEEIRIAETEIEKFEARLNLARYQQLPDFKVGLFYAGIGTPDVSTPPRHAGDDALGIQLGVTIPLWSGKNKGRIEKARAELVASQSAKSTWINDTFATIRANYFRLENARRVMTLYAGELLPQAAKSMLLAETWFQEGESGFSDFVETQSVWYNFQLALARAQADYGKYLARLERLVGRSLTGTHSQAQPPPPATDTKADTQMAFEMGKKRIEALKSGWDKPLDKGNRNHFYLPAMDLSDRFGLTFHDAQATAKHLASGVSLDVLETATFLRNPGVKSAEHQFQAAKEAFSQVSNLDEILRTYSVYTESLSTGIGPMKGNGKDSVKNYFPFPGVLSLKGQVVNQVVRAAWFSLEAARRDAVTGARKAYWNLNYNRNAQQITDATLGLLSQLESVATTRYESGKASYQDVIKVRIQREKLKEQLVTLKENRKNLEQKIFELVNLSPGNRLGTITAVPLSSTVPAILPLYDLALENRQELGRLRAMVGKTERMIELAETMILPPYTMNLSLYEDEPSRQVGASATKPSFPTTVMAARGAGLPRLPWYGSDDAYLRQTRQKLKALREDLRAAENVTRSLVRSAWFNLDRARREETLYRLTVVGLSRSALDVSTQGYESGRVTFADVIGAYTQWLNAGLSLEGKRRDFGIYRAELARLVGMDMNEIQKRVSTQE